MVVTSRNATFKFHLLHKDGNVRVSEQAVRSDGRMLFKASLLYADKNEAVKLEDFPNLDNLSDPPFAEASKAGMVNGTVHFVFKFKVSSMDTKPRHRQFVLKVTPDMDDMVDNPNLTVLTPAFTVAAKV